ncbi:MAG: hypothetical protein WC197_06805 [Candidatus Gastranaerophilaceae bacterium]|jgi:hypothetical protein
MFEQRKKLKELELKIKVFEKLTGSSFDRWFEGIGSLEHQYYSKLSDLEKREERIKAREELFDNSILAAKIKARGEYEENYNHQMHDYIQKITKDNLEVMKSFAEAIKGNKVEIINNK